MAESAHHTPWDATNKFMNSIVAFWRFEISLSVTVGPKRWPPDAFTD